MALYSYKCAVDGHFESLRRGDRADCPYCGRESVRVFRFNVGDSFQPHFNPEFGTYLTSRQHAMDEAKRISDKQSAVQGYDVNMTVCDMFDTDARGLDKAELAETKARTQEAEAKKVSA